MKAKYYLPGEPILLREIWDGKIWTARPLVVAQDNSELIALYIQVGMRWKHHHGLASDHITARERKNKEWMLQDTVWEHYYGYLKLVIPGESYSVLLFRNRDASLRRWYINLESQEAPMHRTNIGFDCTDMILDLIIEPNLKDWRWDDEDELKEAVDLGLVSKEQSQALYQKGAEIRDLIMSGKSIFNGWEKWRPDPNWKVPVLPEGWDVV